MHYDDHVIVVLPQLCTLLGIAGLSSSFFLISHFKQAYPSLKENTNSRQRCSLCLRLTCSPPTFSLSMHGIEIISRASLCCCMEGMGVFEQDLLDNIRSTQISFHARLFHAVRAAHTGMLIWLLLLRKFKRETSNSLTKMYLLGIRKLAIWWQNNFMTVVDVFSCLPNCLPFHLFAETLYWKRNWESRKQTWADRQLSDVVAFYGMMDWPYRWPF